MWVAVAAAFLSAAFFGASSALQQRAASSDGKEKLSGVKLVAELATEGRWWLGMVLSAVAFALHAVALSGAMLALVQPIIVSGLVFAVFVRGALERRLPPRSTAAWCTVTWAGLAAFIAVVHTSPPEPPRLGAAAWYLVVSAALVSITVAAARRSRSDERRGLLFGAAAGALFGLVAGLAKVVLTDATSRWWLAAEHWPLWALLAVGAGAVMLNQRAFQATRLSVTMPMVNIVNVMVAIAFGFAVFRERLFSTPTSLVIEVIAMVAMGVGVRRLASSGDDEDSRPNQPNDNVETSV